MNKKGVSVIVGYVLLITIGVALSVLVYTWLRGYVDEDPVGVCPDETSLVLQDYSCVNDGELKLRLTLKNKGKFSIDGFVVRVNDDPRRDFGIYEIADEIVEIKPGEFVYPESVENKGYSVEYKFSDAGDGVTQINVIDIQPYVLDENTDEQLNCNRVSTQKVDLDIATCETI